MAQRGLLKGSQVLDFFFFLVTRMACGILVPQPGIEPAFPVLEAQSHSQWTAGEVSGF